MSVPQASTRAQELSSQMFSGIMLQCGNCGVSDGSVAIYETLGCCWVSVTTCNKEECKVWALEVFEAKQRVFLHFPLNPTTISVTRSDGSLESGFETGVLLFSESRQKFIIRVSKPNPYTEKGVFISDVAKNNSGVVLYICHNRFVDSELLDYLNSVAGYEMFKM